MQSRNETMENRVLRRVSHCQPKKRNKSSKSFQLILKWNFISAVQSVCAMLLMMEVAVRLIDRTQCTAQE